MVCSFILRPLRIHRLLQYIPLPVPRVDESRTAGYEGLLFTVVTSNKRQGQGFGELLLPKEEWASTVCYDIHPQVK